MNEIDERAETHLHKRWTAIVNLVEQNNLSKDIRKSMTFHCYHDYKIGATEQKVIDHSEEHLEWIIKQHNAWKYEMWHCDVANKCTFKEWIDKHMEE